MTVKLPLLTGRVVTLANVYTLTMDSSEEKMFCIICPYVK